MCTNRNKRVSHTHTNIKSWKNKYLLGDLFHPAPRRLALGMRKKQSDLIVLNTALLLSPHTHTYTLYR